jgi:hypothetical protein
MVAVKMAKITNAVGNMKKEELLHVVDGTY